MKKNLSKLLVISLLLTLSACGSSSDTTAMTNGQKETAADSIVAIETEDKTELHDTEPSEIETTETADQADEDFYITNLKALDYITLGNYKGLTYSIDDEYTFTEDNLQEEINSLLQNQSSYNKITDRAAKEGDYCLVSYTIYDSEKEVIDGMSADKVYSTLGSGDTAVSGVLVEGLEESFYGMMPGEAKTVTLIYPEDYYLSDMAGLEVQVDLELYEINELVEPELNDEFAASLEYPGVSTVEELKEYIRDYYNAEADDAIRDELIAQVIENSTINEYPEQAVSYRKNLYLDSYKEMAQIYGITYEEFITEYLDMAQSELELEAEYYAEESVASDLVLQAIFETEGLSMESEDFISEGDTLAKEYGFEDLNELIDANGKSIVYSAIIAEMGYKVILENATEIKAN